MKKKIFVLSSLILSFCLILGACSGSALPEGFVKDEVIAKAENVITLLSEKNYEAVVETFSAEMAKTLDAKGIENALESHLESLGEFKAFKSEAVTGKNDKSSGSFVIAVIVCSYESGTATYTISIDKDGNVCGLYMK